MDGLLLFPSFASLGSLQALYLQESMPSPSGIGVALFYPEFQSSVIHTGTLSGVHEIGALYLTVCLSLDKNVSSEGLFRW